MDQPSRPQRAGAGKVIGRFDRMLIAIASWAPIRLIGELGPERLALNFGCALIGLGGLMDTPRGLLGTWPGWFAKEWSAAMLLGGVCALWGITRRSRLVEWVGYVCIGSAALLFGLGSLFEIGLSSVRVAILFLAIAAAKGVRLLLAYAARATYLRSVAGRKDGRP